MKKVQLLIVFLLFSCFVFSQVYKGREAEAKVKGSDIVRFKDFSELPNFIHFSDAERLDKAKAIDLTKSFFDDNKLNLIEKNIQKNKNGDETHRFQQIYNNIPIEFTAWNLQIKNEEVYALNGDLFADVNIVSDFSITPDEALNLALQYIGAEKYMWEDNGEEKLLKTFLKNENATYFPKAEKVLVPAQAKFENSTLYSAYKFDIYSKKPHQRKDVYIDATSGKVLFSLSKLYENDAVGTAHTQYSGIQQINTTYDSGMGQYILNDDTRGGGIRTLNCQNTSEYENAIDFYDDDNIWNNVNAQLDEYATDAHFATASTYDYFYTVHGRNSIDDDGHALWSYIHFDLIDYGFGTNVNAFWNGSWMTYGDGDETITPLTTVDICAHEITHGLTTHTAGLNYQDESGALNEAFSDIFGTAVEFYAKPDDANYLIGSEIGIVMRSIADPNSTGKPDTYQGNYWVYGESDYGGVHTNGIPLCYGFYLLCEGGSGTNDLGNDYDIIPIGMDKAEQVFFRLLTVYLTPNSNYHDAWFFAMQAAADLYGACSSEVQSVGEMFYAIGVADEPYVNTAHANFTASYTQSCEAPFSVSFFNKSYNGNSFLWNFGDGNTSTEINPTHIYNSEGYYNVTLTVYGGVCGSAYKIKDNFVQIDPNLPCVTIFPEYEHITVNKCNGIIYDSGGPDEKYFANTNSSVTIHAAGSDSIILNILEFDIEEGSGSECNYDYIAFYDGPSISSQLINGTKYCNTTGNPGVISSTGEYITIEFYSDEGLSREGFKIQYDCINATNPPTPYFSAINTYSCDGYIEFVDNSINYPQTYEWDFGDGNFSNEQNPTHKYLSSGIYTVKLRVENENGSQILTKTDYITIDLPEASQLVPLENVCIDQAFVINQNVEGELNWFDSLESTNAIFTGNTWQHEAISEPVTYWVEEFFESENYYVGSNNSNSNGGYFGNPSYIHYLIFDAYKPFKLRTVKVNAQESGDRFIALRTSTQEIIAQKSVYCIDGTQIITLNFDVPIGYDLQLVGLGAPDLFRNSSNVNYPYEIEDIVSIKASSAGTEPYNYYYYFYNWKIQTYDCTSARTEFEIIPHTCSNIENISVQNLSIFPNPSKGVFSFNNLDNLDFEFKISDVFGKILLKGNSEQKEIDISHFANGVYFVEINSENGNKFVKLVKNS
ncbi:MAG TPA: M4 family metallopeptidase [Bacteroidales bacterium]|nr:M4 family metallopeptidase [Bacteroidales bacterium]HQB21673.1 M4 family metallopeptidase [Bacteroidales bacterium]